MYFFHYLTIVILVTFSIKGTSLHRLPNSAIHDYSPEAYNNKYCRNHKCGEFGECVGILKNPANDNTDDKYICRCNKCYRGEYCNINYCEKENSFFSPIRMMLFLLTLLTSIFYIFGFCRFLSFYFKYIYGMKTIMKATNQYYIDSSKELNDVDGKSPTILILRKAINVNSSNDITKTKMENKSKGKKSTFMNKMDNNAKNVSKHNNLNLATSGSETRRFHTSSKDEEKGTTLNSTNDTSTSQTNGDSSKSLDVVQPNILTPFPTKFKMANIFGKEKLLQLGVIGTSNDNGTKSSKDQNQL
uniref:EGF-like domain-containing protein n=1 Tax=Strongyloides venezuelensis TaxID=75913 RepID=A0A0K0F3Y8_STRVS